MSKKTLFFFMCLLPLSVYAQNNEDKWGFVDFLLNNAVGISILFIFISAVFGFFMKARSIDKCLRDFNSYTINIETVDNAVYKGILNIYHTGMELLYRKEEYHPSGYQKYSRILYNTEYPAIKKIYRYQHELTEANKKRREKSIKKTYQPGLTRTMFRKIKNILGTFRDAVSESMGIILGQLKKTRPGSQVLNQDKHLKNIGEGIVQHSGNVYDPILEKYIGRHVVIETTQKEEFVGIFKEYSQNYLELLNVQIREKHKYIIHAGKKNICENAIQLHITRAKKKILIKNLAPHEVYIAKIGHENEMIPLDKLLKTEEETEISNGLLPAMENNNEIWLEFIKPIDIIIPRMTAFVRYCADERKLTWKEALKTDFESVWSMTTLKKKS